MPEPAVAIAQRCTRRFACRRGSRRACWPRRLSGEWPPKCRELLLLVKMQVRVAWMEALWKSQKSMSRFWEALISENRGRFDQGCSAVLNIRRKGRNGILGVSYRGHRPLVVARYLILFSKCLLVNCKTCNGPSWKVLSSRS